MALVACPECDQQISDKARACPHCGFERPAYVHVEPAKKMGCGQIFLIGSACLVGALVVLGFIGAAMDHSGTETGKGGPTDACYMAQQFIEKRLRAPSTAEFSSCLDQNQSTIQKDDFDVYTVTGYVDAQNGFGAKLRKNYTVKLHKVQGTTSWQSDEVDINDD